MVTTIQLRENIKLDLDRIKNQGQTYEDVIVNLIKIAEQSKRKNKELLKEGYIEIANESKKINGEWSAIDKSWD